MLNSITGQIKKLDHDINDCKEKINAFKISHINSCPIRFVQTRGRARSTAVMNRKKTTDCEKHKKVSIANRPLNDKSNKNQGTYDSTGKKNQRTKQRSRSVSCGRDCHCHDDYNFHHNDLLANKRLEQLKHKISWANILKEHNDQNTKKVISNSNSKGYSENNNNLYPTSIYLKNRGVQCTETSFIHTKTNCSTDAGFSPYNPTRTLQFLISEFKENLKHKREDKLLNIVNDMENAVFRLNSNQEYPASYEPKVNSNLHLKPNLNNFLPNENVNKIFEESFAKLETTCKTLEVTCARLKEENKQLQLDLHKKETNISIMEKKDKDNLDKIDLLNKHIYMVNQKVDQYSQSIQDLTKLLNKLQQENKCIEPLKEINMRLNSKIVEVNKEKESAVYENHRLILKSEKLIVLLEMKEKQLSNLKDAFLGLGDQVRKEVRVVQGRCVSEESGTDSSAPLCSSPNTSVSILAPPYGSWRGVSRVSSNMDSVCPSPQPQVDPVFPMLQPQRILGNKYDDKLLYTQAPHAKTVHSVVNPFEQQIQLPPGLNIDSRNDQCGRIEGLRGQIKMLFTDQAKVPSTIDNSKIQPQWKNLASIHSSITSYNTTT